MGQDKTDERLDYLEGELTAAGDIATRFTHAQEALGLVLGILRDLVSERDDAHEFEDDLERLEALSRSL